MFIFLLLLQKNAADKIIREIYGLDKPNQETENTPPETEPETSLIDKLDASLLVLLNSIITQAHAQQADINISSPTINKIKSQMTSRHKQLTPFYTAGAVGMDNNGLITIKDIKAVTLDKRNVVKKYVNDENRDRGALYVEIARANGHPEWESEIRDTFARRWIANAPSGWWYKTANGWKQK